MNAHHLLTTLLKIIVVTLVMGFAAQIAAANEKTAAADNKPATVNLRAPEGMLLVEEDVWYQLADEPGRHFHEARHHRLRGEHAAAAADIRKGTAMLKLAAALSPVEIKKPLEASILELETLAATEAAGKVRSAHSFDRIFARSFYVLAAYNEEMARRHIKEEEPEKAGFHLRAAGRDYAEAMSWQGERVTDDATELLESAEATAAKLLQGATNLFREAAQSLDALHLEFEQLKALIDQER